MLCMCTKEKESKEREKRRNSSLSIYTLAALSCLHTFPFPLCFAALKKVTCERLERMLGKSIRQDIVDRFFRELRDSLISSFFQASKGSKPSLLIEPRLTSSIGKLTKIDWACEPPRFRSLANTKLWRKKGRLTSEKASGTTLRRRLTSMPTYPPHSHL